MKPKSLAVLIMALFPPLVCAEAAAPGGKDPENQANVSYVGETFRLGIGYDSETHLRGELYGVLSEDERSSWIGELWASGGAGGVKLSRNWLPLSATPEDIRVAKMFLALDQNDEDDRKVTVGYGQENQGGFWGAYASAAVTGKRLHSRSTSTSTETITGTDNIGPYEQEVITTFFREMYLKPYDYGLGVRLGRYYDEPQVRLTGGFDYEIGKSGASQFTLSLLTEKFFGNTPHSLALNLEALHKTGDHEPDDSDLRGYLMYRYDLSGRAYKPLTTVRNVPVQAAAGTSSGVPTDPPAPAPAAVSVAEPAPAPVEPPPPRTEKRLVKTTASLSTDAFFDFDKNTLRPATRKMLEDVLARIQKQGYTGNIKITGHTCDIGTVPYNQKLSERRAKAVAEFFKSAGLSGEVLVVEGKGELEPRFPNTRADRHKNRRVDIEYVTYMSREEIVTLPGEPVAPPPAAKPGAARPDASPARPAVPAPVEWRQEEIEAEPAWVRRALRSSLPHKQVVDVYRIEKKRTEKTHGDKVYLNQGGVSAANDSYQVNSNSSNNLFNVLANDSTTSGGALSIKTVGSAAHGSTSISGDKVVYTPAPGYVGPDSFVYTVADNLGGSASATVSINVVAAGANQPPVAVDDIVDKLGGLPVHAYVLNNDSDPDGDSLSIVSITTPANGTAAINGDHVVYFSNYGYCGPDKFSYTITDGRGGSATAWVYVKSSGVMPNYALATGATAGANVCLGE